ncbi:MAG: helix-turn-helix domain-containing protein [Faecalibacterium sp.]|nr:helix-turn-helix domain-containing protein [Faecalibacterium sp.]
MTVGQKIKRVRVFRKMTQKDLGLAIGLGQNGANRLAQYEMNYRVPKKELLDKIAKALDVNPMALEESDLGSASDLMETLFWMEEQSRGCIRLFQMRRNDEKHNYDSNKLVVEYREVEDMPAHQPTGIYFKYNTVDQFLAEWRIRQEELRDGHITQDEYFEWKLNWPATCDNLGKFEPTKQWRKLESEKSKIQG